MTGGAAPFIFVDAMGKGKHGGLARA